MTIICFNQQWEDFANAITYLPGSPPTPPHAVSTGLTPQSMKVLLLTNKNGELSFSHPVLAELSKNFIWGGVRCGAFLACLAEEVQSEYFRLQVGPWGRCTHSSLLPWVCTFEAHPPAGGAAEAHSPGFLWAGVGSALLSLPLLLAPLARRRAASPLHMLCLAEDPGVLAVPLAGGRNPCGRGRGCGHLLVACGDGRRAERVPGGVKSENGNGGV